MTLLCLVYYYVSQEQPIPTETENFMDSPQTTLQIVTFYFPDPCMHFIIFTATKLIFTVVEMLFYNRKTVVPQL